MLGRVTATLATLRRPQIDANYLSGRSSRRRKASRLGLPFSGQIDRLRRAPRNVHRVLSGPGGGSGLWPSGRRRNGWHKLQGRAVRRGSFTKVLQAWLFSGRQRPSNCSRAGTSARRGFSDEHSGSRPAGAQKKSGGAAPRAALNASESAWAPTPAPRPPAARRPRRRRSPWRLRLPPRGGLGLRYRLRRPRPRHDRFGRKR